MPTISLRLTPEQHAELERWAYDSQRSIQKELIFRLFSGQLPERVPTKGADASDEVLERAARGVAGSNPASASSRSGSCPMNPPRGTKCKTCGKVHA